MEVERLKLRKCPEFPTFSAFRARLPLGAGEEGSEPGFQLRWVGVERETREGEFEMLSSEYLRSAEYDGFPEEEIGDFTNMSSSSYSSPKFCKSQRMPLNILAAEEKPSKCCCKAGVPRMKP